jgi:hypothetical protein
LRPLPRAALLGLGLALAACASGGDAGDSSAGDDSGTLQPLEDGASDATSAPDARAADTSTTMVEASPAPEASATDSAPGDDGGGAAEAGVPESGADSAGSSCAAHGFSGALVTFDLSAQTGSEASAAPTSSAAGVTGGVLSRASGLTAVSGAGSINASGWPTASSADQALYYAFSVTPAAGCTVALTSLALDLKASSSGPANASVGTSADAYASLSTPVAGNSTGTVTLSASAAAPITVHVFGYGATSTGGTLRIQNTMTLSGTIN